MSFLYNNDITVSSCEKRNVGGTCSSAMKIFDQQLGMFDSLRRIDFSNDFWVISHWENRFFESKKHFFDMRSRKKFLWIKESFVNSKKCSLIQRNRFVYIKEYFVQWSKLSSIQRNLFFDRISKKCFFKDVLLKITFL